MDPRNKKPNFENQMQAMNDMAKKRRLNPIGRRSSCTSDYYFKTSGEVCTFLNPLHARVWYFVRNWSSDTETNKLGYTNTYCHDHLPGPEFYVVWLWKMLASEWWSLWESSWLVPWSVPYAYPDVSGAVPEWPWIIGFMRKSSRRDSAPKIQFLVLLNSWDNLFVILPSISSKTWAM